MNKAKANRVLSREHTDQQTPFSNNTRELYTWISPDGQYQNQINYIFATEDGEALYSQKKQDLE